MRNIWMRKLAKVLIIIAAIGAGTFFALDRFGQFLRLSVINPVCPKCNIVIIDIDGLRADALSCYGNPRNVTPNICNLADKGVLFEKNFSQSWWTLPSMFSTITSLYPPSHGVLLSFVDTLSPKIKTLAELFNKAGYKTISLGRQHEAKIHLNNGGLAGFEIAIDNTDYNSNWEKIFSDNLDPNRPLFIHYYVEDLHFPYLLDDEVEDMLGVERVEEIPTTYVEFDAYLANYVEKNYLKIFTEKTINANPEIFDQNRQDRTLSIFKFYKSLRERKDVLSFLQERDSPYFFTYKEIVEEAISKTNDPDRIIDYIRSLYQFKIAQIDQQIGGLISLLQDLRFSRNTIIVVMSDHGEEFMEHGNLSHVFLASLYNELLHVPLIIKVPGLLSYRSSKITQNIDIFPTLLDLTGVESYRTLGYRIQGKSLLDSFLPQRNLLRWFREKDKHSEDFAVSVVNEWEKVAIQDNRWKLILNFEEGVTPSVELYDLLTENKESLNVAKEHLDVVSKFVGRISGIIDESRVYPKGDKQTYQEWISKDKIERMKKEGYF